MNKLDELIRIINGSKSYEFEDGTTLKLTGYYTGETVRLDLGLLIEEYPDVVEEIIVKDEDEEEEDY